LPESAFHIATAAYTFARFGMNARPTPELFNSAQTSENRELRKEEALKSGLRRSAIRASRGQR
jgi:hypothetical protein